MLANSGVCFFPVADVVQISEDNTWESLRKEKWTEKLSTNGQTEVGADKLGLSQAIHSVPITGVPAWSIA